MKPVLEVKNLSKVYKISHTRKAYHTLKEDLIEAAKTPIRFLRGHRVDKEEFWALKDVSFTVNQGEVLGIIGRNGAGKSTLLKILSRIASPTAGSAIMRGRVASLLEVGTGFHPELTGRENIYLNGSLLGMSRKEIDRKFDEIVAFAEVEKFLDTPVKFYSSGMHVRLAFAVAAHLEPEILIVDEVLAVGDAAFQKKSLGKMSEVAKGGRTVLFVSHNMNAIQRLCEKVVYLENGELKDFGDNVPRIIHKYLSAGKIISLSSEWVSERKEQGDYFVPSRLALTDSKSRVVRESVSGDSETWVQIEGEVKDTDPALTIGYALYAESGEPLFWSYPTDVSDEEWVGIKEGPIVFRSRIPTEILNEGSYKLELIGGIHFKEWHFEPGVNAPAVHLNISKISSRSSYWLARRPTFLAPVLRWDIKQNGFLK